MSQIPTLKKLFEVLRDMAGSIENEGLPTAEFEIWPRSFQIDGNQVQIPLLLSYERSDGARFRTIENSDIVRSFKAVFAAGGDGLAHFDSEGSGCELLCISTQSNDKSMLERRYVPSRQPIIVGGSVVVNKVDGIVFNGPDQYFKSSDIFLETDKFTVELKFLDQGYECYKQKRKRRDDTIPTSSIKLRCAEGEYLSARDATRIFASISVFLTLLKGSNVGIGHLIGSVSGGCDEFAAIGVNRFDPFADTSGWYCRSALSDVSELFKEFWAARNDQVLWSVLRRAIEFYRASNVIRNSSVEMAVVTSHAAAEVLSHFVLERLGGWSGDLLSERIPFHSKLRASSARIGLDDDILEKSNELRVRSRDFNGADGFELISIFRNRMVHPAKSIDYTGLEAHDVWQVLQWLNELHILFLLNYRGKMTDRRIRCGFAGEGEDIPLKPGFR